MLFKNSEHLEMKAHFKKEAAAVEEEAEVRGRFVRCELVRQPSADSCRELPPLSHRKEMREAAAKKREERVQKAAERIERQKVEAEKLSIVSRSGGSPTMPPTQSVDACIEKNFNKYAK